MFEKVVNVLYSFIKENFQEKNNHSKKYLERVCKNCHITIIKGTF